MVAMQRGDRRKMRRVRALDPERREALIERARPDHDTTSSVIRMPLRQ